MSTTSDRSSAVEGRLKPSFLLLVYTNAFITGAVVMGFEMLGSRYLNPYFGSGIYTWAALISTVLAALTAGYFFGGWMADRRPTPAGLGWLIVGGSLYLGVIPLFADGMLDLLSGLLGAISDQREFERWGSIMGAMLLLFVPLALLGVYSPYAIRLTLRATTRSGTVAGRVYGISTLGSIFGTLFVTFYLIPTMGSRHITYLLATVGVLAGLSFLAIRPAGIVRAAHVSAALVLAIVLTAAPAAFAEAPSGRIVPAQASPEDKEAAEKFIAYLRKQNLEVRHGAIEARAGAGGFRIVDLVAVGRNKSELRAASFEAAAFAERDGGEAALTDVTALRLEAREGEKTSFTADRATAEALTWRAGTASPQFAVRRMAVRDMSIAPRSGETLRVASFDAATLRLDGPNRGGVEALAIRTITVSGGKETGSIGAVDMESLAVDMPARIAARGVAVRDLLVNIQSQGAVRIALAELRGLEAVNLGQRNPADLRVLEFTLKDLEAPVTGGADPAFEREMRELGYTMLKMNAELAYRYQDATKSYELGKLEIDVADMARFTLGFTIAGLTPEEIKKALEPPPRPPGEPGPPGSERRQGAAAVGLLARLNLVSADIAYRDKSILARVIKREAQRRQTDEAAVRAQYRALVIGLRDEQTDPLAREALDAVIAFIDDPGELIVEVRPPAPLNLMAVGALFASNPAQLRSMLGIKILATKP